MLAVNTAFSTFSQIPIDWLLIGVFFVLVAADALRAGSTHATALSVSLPVSLFLYSTLSKTIIIGSFLGQANSSIAQAAIFLILEVILFVCINQMLYSFEHFTSLLSSTVAAFAATVVVLVIWLQVPALQSLWHFDGQIQTIFGASYSFFWLIAAYLALAYAGS